MTVTTRYVTKPQARPAKQPRRSLGLDRLDVRVLRELLQGNVSMPLNPAFRKSFRSIARTLKVEEDTVRSRVGRLEQIGFIKEWCTHPNPNILGIKENMIWLDIPSSTSKDDLVEKLKLLPDVLIIAKYYGTLIGIVLIYETDLSLMKSISLIRRLSNAFNLIRGNVLWPEANIQLSKSDWQILSALFHDPRKTYLGVSTGLGISARTVQAKCRKDGEWKGALRSTKYRS